MSGAIINMGGLGHLGGLYVDRIFWRDEYHTFHQLHVLIKEEKIKSQIVSSEWWCLEVVPV